MTDYQFEQIFREMSFDMIKDILKYTESPSKSIPKLLSEIRELTGAKIVAIFRCPSSYSIDEPHAHKMLGINPKRKKGLIKSALYEKLLMLSHQEKEIFIIDENHHQSCYSLLQNKGIGLSLVMPIVADVHLMGSFIILGLPTKNNLNLLIKGLQTLANLFALTFKGSIFYLDMEKRVAERTKSLQESEKRYKNILQTTNDGFWNLSAEGNILDVNDAYCKMSGYSRAELLKMNISDLEINKNYSEINNHLKTVIHQGPDRFETTHKRKDGTTFMVEVSVSYMESNGNSLIAFLRDITTRKESELALKESEARFKALHNASFGGIVIHDKGLILECNAGLSKITGFSYDELIGMDGLLLISDDTRDLVVKHISEGYEKAYEAVGIRKDGSRYPLRLEARVIPYQGKQVRVVEFRDITEIKEAEKERIKLESQLKQSQKMQAIGTLTGGIAHDFNNLLTPIMGYADLMRYRLPADSPYREFAEDILSSSTKAKDLIQQLLTFSQKHSDQPEPIHMIQTIKESLKFLRSSIPSSIQIDFNYDNEVGNIIANTTQIQQVLMNICINASHAIEGEEGNPHGKINIDLRQIFLDESDITDFFHLEPGWYARLKITDNGEGMDEETLSHIFEPFYSTKEEGKGTGMGLAVVHGIIASYNGEIKVHSHPGKGTSFNIYFPITELSKIDKPQESKSDEINRYEAKLYVLDDRYYVTNLVRNFLTPLGFKITASNNSKEALDELMTNASQYDLLITDLTMPELSGLDIAKTLSGSGIDMPIILLTGYGESIENVSEHGIDAIIHKPILLKDLLNELDRLL